MFSLKDVESIALSRPEADHGVEQVLMTPESMRRQGMLLQEVIEPGSRVVSLGDDDHMTILLGSVMSANIVVFENDDRIIASLKDQVAQRSISPYNTVKHNLRLKIPQEYEGQFDVCLSNPPYSSKNEGFGIKTWISRSRQLLRDGGLGLVVIPLQSELPWSLRNMIIVQEYLTKLGCAIIRVDKDVHAYDDANDAGLMSSNIWYQVVDAPQLGSMIGDVENADALYR